MKNFFKKCFSKKWTLWLDYHEAPTPVRKGELILLILLVIGLISLLVWYLLK